MRNRRAPVRDAVAIPGGESWFISLGDLLTLLVCFFLVLTPQIPSNTKARQDNQIVSSQAARMSDVGTELASHPIDRISSAVAVLPVWRDLRGLAGQPGEGGSDSRSWLKELRSAVESGERVVVKLCDREVEQQVVEEVAAESTVRQASVSNLTFEVDSACAEFSERAALPGQLAAVVMFAGK